jgi:hypothetical protein
MADAEQVPEGGFVEHTGRSFSELPHPAAVELGGHRRAVWPGEVG